MAENSLVLQDDSTWRRGNDRKTSRATGWGTEKERGRLSVPQRPVAALDSETRGA